MTIFFQCDKCKKRMDKRGCRLLDSNDKIYWDFCPECVGLLGEWLES